MVIESNDYLAEDKRPCPHYEDDCEWQTEYWRDLKTTGYEHRVCRNCSLHVERRPLKALTDMVLPHFMMSESEPNVFDIIGEALLGMDKKRFDAITEDTPQEVGHGENISNDTPSPR